jgi:hypothetical protein
MKKVDYRSVHRWVAKPSNNKERNKGVNEYDKLINEFYLHKRERMYHEFVEGFVDLEGFHS